MYLEFQVTTSPATQVFSMMILFFHSNVSLGRRAPKLNNSTLFPFSHSQHVSSVLRDQVPLAVLFFSQILLSEFGDVMRLSRNVSLYEKGVYVWKPAVLLER